jgi:hypothetical protein
MGASGDVTMSTACCQGYLPSCAYIDFTNREYKLPEFRRQNLGMRYGSRMLKAASRCDNNKMQHPSSVSRHSFRALTLVQKGAIVVCEQLTTSGITRYLMCVCACVRARVHVRMWRG